VNNKCCFADYGAHAGVASDAVRTEYSVLLNHQFPSRIWERAHGVDVSRDTPYGGPDLYDAWQFSDRCLMERFLLLWDDMDDWLSAALHLFGRRMA
jgi:hypothetical protein